MNNFDAFKLLGWRIRKKDFIKAYKRIRKHSYVGGEGKYINRRTKRFEQELSRDQEKLKK